MMLGLALSPSAPRAAGITNLDAFLASLSTGFRYNFRKTDRFFQEAIGPTLADDVGEVIGLALDQRLWRGQTLAQLRASQPLLLNEPFDVGTGWGVVVGGGSVTGGQLVADGSATTRWYKDITGLAAGWYEVTGDTTGAGRQIICYDGAGFTTNIGSTVANTIGGRAIVKLTNSTTMRIYLYSGSANAGYWDNIIVRRLPGNHAVQTGIASLKPTRQAAGAKSDGSDDNLLTAYTAVAGKNLLAARTTVPASLAAAQVIAGASGSGANRLLIGINTAGFACAGLGSDDVTTIVGSTDLRGTQADIALTCDGSTARLIVNGAVEYEAAQNGTPTTTIPLRIGANNNNGTAASFYAGASAEIIGGSAYIALPDFKQIRRLWDAAA